MGGISSFLWGSRTWQTMGENSLNIHDLTEKIHAHQLNGASPSLSTVSRNVKEVSSLRDGTT